MSEDVLAGMCGSDSDCSAGELCIDGTCVGGDLSGGICDGCYENDKCYKIGFVKGTDYCSEYFVFVPRLGAKEFCVENYECLSNLCSNGGCAREAGFLKRLIEWLRDSIGGKEKIQLSLIEAYNDAGGYTNDKVIFQDSSGQTYETAFGSEGEGVLSINGKNVPVLFADTPNIVGDEYVLVGDQFVSEKGLALKLTEVFNDVGTYANDKVVFEDNKGGEYSAVFVIEGKGLLTIYGQVFNIILRSDQGVRIDKHLIFKNRYKNNIHVFDIDGDFNTVTLRI